MSVEILTVQEIAALLKVGDKTVYTMAQRREIPSFKIRGQWRFKRDDINSWIAKLKRRSTGVTPPSRRKRAPL